MVALSDLNDDCLTAILSYLAFAQLFACISSLQLKNKAFYRCALAALKRIYGPFGLEAEFRSLRPWNLWSTDAKRRRWRQLKVPQKIAESALAESIEQAQVPFVYDYACCHLDVWFNIMKALLCINSLSIRVIRKSNAASSYVHSSLDTLTLALSPLFPQLRSLAVVGSDILPGSGIAALMEVIGQMPGVVSLKIPSYMLKAFLTRLPVKANELSELILYRHSNDDGPDKISCASVIDAVCDAGCEELTHLKYTCRWRNDGLTVYDLQLNSHDCIQAFAQLQKLPKLHALTLDIDFGPLDHKTLPRTIDNRVDLVPLSELNVTLRSSNFIYRAVWTFSLLRQFTNLRAAYITTVHPEGVDAHRSLVDLIGSALSHTAATLRELTLESFRDICKLPPCLPPLLPKNLHDFGKLEQIVVTGCAFGLCDVPIEWRTKSNSGYPSVLELIERLRSCRSLKSAKVRAGVYSADEIKAVLPDCCEVVGVVERVCAFRLMQGIFVLRQDRYWRPVEILVSIEKDAVCVANETTKLALRIISPR